MHGRQFEEWRRIKDFVKEFLFDPEKMISMVVTVNEKLPKDFVMNVKIFRRLSIHHKINYIKEKLI